MRASSPQYRVISARTPISRSDMDSSELMGTSINQSIHSQLIGSQSLQEMDSSMVMLQYGYHSTRQIRSGISSAGILTSSVVPTLVSQQVSPSSNEISSRLEPRIYSPLSLPARVSPHIRVWPEHFGFCSGFFVRNIFSASNFLFLNLFSFLFLCEKSVKWVVFHSLLTIVCTSRKP
jgi:hypothetical protein